jgi:hypothetical protein
MNKFVKTSIGQTSILITTVEGKVYLRAESEDEVSFALVKASDVQLSLILSYY